MAQDGSGDYLSITSAIAGVPEGATLLIKNGTYEEFFTVSKPLTLQNYPGHAPLIDGSAEKTTVIAVTANYCVLRGLKIRGSQNLGVGTHFHECNIMVYPVIHLTVEDCEIYEFNHCGIKMFEGFLTARNNVIHTGGWTNSDHCIYLATGAPGGHVITDNEFYGCAGWGAHLYTYEYATTISGNNIYDNFGGLLICGVGHTITDNVIENNLGGKGICFFHYGLIDLLVTGNQCSGNTSHDLYLDVSPGEGFVNCTIENNTGTKNF